MYRNAEMYRMLNAATKYLDRRDVIGYAAARNVRVLSEELTEYVRKIQDLVAEHGEPVIDADGNETGQLGIKVGGPGYEAFVREMAQYDEIEGDPRIMTLDYEQAIGALSGNELLELDWMFADS